MSDPMLSWLAAQREAMERWLAAPPADAQAAQSEMQRWWQTIAQTASPEAQALAQQLGQIGPGFLAGTGDALFDLFGLRDDSSAANAASGAADRWPLERWMRIAPIGYFREHQAHAQELARAVEEYRHIAMQMAQAITRIHGDALELLAKRVQSLAAQGAPVADSHRLYALWIESGEQAFAQHARGESYGRLQGDLVNASARLRMAQQTIAEQFLKSLDLPTRAELNSLHKRVKDMRDRIERLEATQSMQGAGDASKE